jgi:hypothetical protein
MSETTFTLNLLPAIPQSPDRSASKVDVEVKQRAVLVRHDNSIAFVDSTKKDERNPLANRIAKAKGKFSGKESNGKGLGSWHFDKKLRKRRYVSLTGKSLMGAAAVHQAKSDKIRYVSNFTTRL